MTEPAKDTTIDIAPKTQPTQGRVPKIVSEINKLSDNGPHIIDIPDDASLDDLKIILKTNKDKLSALAKTNTQKTSLIKKIKRNICP